MRDSLKDSPRRRLSPPAKVYRDQFDKAIKSAADARIHRGENRAQCLGPARHHPRLKTPAENQRSARQAAAISLLDKMNKLRQTVGFGIFDSLLSYESAQFDQLVQNTLSLRPRHARPPAGAEAAEAAIYRRADLHRSQHLWRSDTIAGCIANMTITAPLWLFYRHRPHAIAAPTTPTPGPAGSK